MARSRRMNQKEKSKVGAILDEVLNFPSKFKKQERGRNSSQKISKNKHFKRRLDSLDKEIKDPKESVFLNSKESSLEVASTSQKNQNYISKTTLSELQKENNKDIFEPIFLNGKSIYNKSSNIEIDSNFITSLDDDEFEDITKYELKEPTIRILNKNDNINSQNIVDLNIKDREIKDFKEENHKEAIDLNERVSRRSRYTSSKKDKIQKKESSFKKSTSSSNTRHKSKLKKSDLDIYAIYKNMALKLHHPNLETKSLIIMGLCSFGFILFYLLPFIFSIYYSLINNAFDKKFVWFKNYIEVLQNDYFKLALKNTFQFTFIGVGLLIPISFILSIVIVNLSKSLDFVKSAFFIPMLLPTASVIIIWKILFGDYSYIYELLHNNTGRIPIYLLFLWKNCGYNIILFSAAFLSVDKSIYEAASLDGVNTIQKHLYITLPLIFPTVFFIFIISLVNSFKIFKEVYLFYGTSYPQSHLYLVQHYMKNHFDKLNYQNLTTGAIIFAFVVYIIVAIGYKIQDKVASEAWY